MKIKAFIEKGNDNFYSIFSEEMLYNCCFGGYGNTEEEAKEDFMLSIAEAKEMVKEEGYAITDDMQTIEVEFIML